MIYLNSLNNLRVSRENKPRKSYREFIRDAMAELDDSEQSLYKPVGLFLEKQFQQFGSCCMHVTSESISGTRLADLESDKSLDSLRVGVLGKVCCRHFPLSIDLEYRVYPNYSRVYASARLMLPIFEFYPSVGL